MLSFTLSERGRLHRFANGISRPCEWRALGLEIPFANRLTYHDARRISKIITFASSLVVVVELELFMSIVQQFIFEPFFMVNLLTY